MVKEMYRSSKRQKHDGSSSSEEFDNDRLALSLSPPSTRTFKPPTPPPPQLQSLLPGPSTIARRFRRNPTQGPPGGKSDIVPVPFPWATDHRATVYSLDYILSMGIRSIPGEVQCKKCENRITIEFELERKFMEIGSFIMVNKSSLRERAPEWWMSPVLPVCTNCHQPNSMKPVMSEKKRSINWLFLLLGQMLGCCSLRQLKYFCKHTNNHRTGAKDRVLYLTYLGFCKQLDPTGPFDR